MTTHRLRPLALASASLAFLAAGAVLAGPAAADTPGCVSNGEYDRINTGMTMNKAHTIFDTDGRRLGIDGNQQVRGYRACGDAQGELNVGLELVRENGVWRVAQKYRVATVA